MNGSGKPLCATKSAHKLSNFARTTAAVRSVIMGVDGSRDAIELNGAGLFRLRPHPAYRGGVSLSEKA
jgi:hypothetical protein